MSVWPPNWGWPSGSDSWAPNPAVERFYAAGRVLALPTIYDPCSNVVLEALAGGLPVVTTAANGASEFIHPATTAPSSPDPTISPAWPRPWTNTSSAPPTPPYSKPPWPL